MRRIALVAVAVTAVAGVAAHTGSASGQSNEDAASVARATLKNKLGRPLPRGRS